MSIRHECRVFERRLWPQLIPRGDARTRGWYIASQLSRRRRDLSAIGLDQSKQFVGKPDTLVWIFRGTQPAADRIGDVLRQHMDFVRGIDGIDARLKVGLASAICSPKRGCDY